MLPIAAATCATFNEYVSLIIHEYIVMGIGLKEVADTFFFATGDTVVALQVKCIFIELHFSYIPPGVSQPLSIPLGLLNICFHRIHRVPSSPSPCSSHSSITV